ncbi:MAG: ABC transporter ATP-binding protein [Burkholderiales bacterium]|nr:ABC transporter ATP-binding protein [Anaerolineae bacterium]
MSASLLEAKNITVQFGHGANAFNALHDVNFVVQSGEAVGIVGESGSGKTTLARVLVGLQTPTIGEVSIEGTRVFSPDLNHRMPRSERWKAQMIFQDPYSSLNPRMRAVHAVAEAVHVWQGLSRREAETEALRLLQAMGISSDQAQQFPRSLSGGQRQRVSVARALAPNPKVLIADEPTSAIDQSAQAQLLNLLRRLQKDRDLTIVFISHDLSLVRYLTTRVYVMQTGSVVETGSTMSVFEQPQHPYTRLLLDSIPARGN